MATPGLYVDTNTLQVGIGTTRPKEAFHVQGNLLSTGNITSQGTVTASNLSILGDFVTLNTITSNTEQMVIQNAGTGPALKVTQTGANSIAEFYDDGNALALKIADGGNVGIGTANPRSELHINGTGALILPSGTSAQQPSIPVVGMLRYNTDTNKLQYFNPSGWATLGAMIASGGNSIYTFATYRIHVFTSSGDFVVESGGEIEYLVIAGGGGGATQANSSNRGGGGGGAGGMLTGSSSLIVGRYPVVIGAGGDRAPTPYYSVGTNGANSSLSGTGVSVIAIGGGRGGTGNGTLPLTGGSGGGGGAGDNPSIGASGTSGQGNSGGSALGTTAVNGASGGGGGGAGGVGPNTTSVDTTNSWVVGGVGRASDITGTNTVYAMGGASSINASIITSLYRTRPNNTGDGGFSGGGLTEVETNRPAPGGSGIVIIRYRF